MFGISMNMMSVFDLVFLGVVIVALVLIYRQWALLKRANALLPVMLVISAIVLIGAFYLVDLFTMWVLPDLIGHQQAMEFMVKLHVTVSWFNNLMIVLLLFFGLILIVRKLISQLHAQERANQGLEQEVEARTHELKLAKEEAETANLARGRFLANISHEIRTPMNAIIGMTHLALQQETNPAQKNYLEKVQQSSRGLLGIINDLLDFSKIDSGYLEIEKTALRIHSVIEDAITLTRIPAEERNIRVTSRVDVAVPDVLLGDPLRLTQVLVDLIGNAIKFSNSGGSVKLQVNLVAQTDETAELKFEVVDDGVGITAEQRGRLFEPFLQGDISITRRHGGTGLGLVISQDIVRLMGGEIRVESEPGSGSCFSFTLIWPLYRNDAQTADKRGFGDSDDYLKSTLANLAGCRILVAEDNDINQEVIVALLVSNGLLVDAVDNGQQALDKLEQEDYDLVLMDCQMPEKDGYQATREIRQRESLREIPIIALTANVMSGDREKALESGMNDQLGKPIDPDALFFTLEKWIVASDEARDDEKRPAKSGPSTG